MNFDLDRPRVQFVCFTFTTGHWPSIASNPMTITRCWQKCGRKDCENFRLAETEKYAHVTYFFKAFGERIFLRAASPRTPPDCNL